MITFIKVTGIIFGNIHVNRNILSIYSESSFRWEGTGMKKFILLALVALIAVAAFSWQQIEDYRELELVSYKLDYDEYGEMKTIYISMEIEKTEDGYRISTTNTWDYNTDDVIDPSYLFTQSVGYMFISVLNPMYTFLFESFDLEELIPTRIMGFGTIKYEGTEQVGKYEGTRVVLYNEDKEPSIAWVINKDIPLALKTESFQDGNNMVVELLDYKMAE